MSQGRVECSRTEVGAGLRFGNERLTTGSADTENALQSRGGDLEKVLKNGH